MYSKASILKGKKMTLVTNTRHDNAHDWDRVFMKVKQQAAIVVHLWVTLVNCEDTCYV